MSIKIVRLDCFNEQVKQLKSSYMKIEDDLKAFFADFDPEYSDIDLWNWLYKDRLGNKSIPCGKRWWFRVITFAINDRAFPIIIYSKKTKINTSVNEINDKLEDAIGVIKRKKLL